jgi:hypothetical protein
MPKIILKKEYSSLDNAMNQCGFFESLKTNDRFNIENNFNGCAVDLRAKYLNFCISYISEFNFDEETILIESSTFSESTERATWEKACENYPTFCFNSTIKETLEIFQEFTLLLEELTTSNDRLCISVYSPKVFENTTEAFLTSEEIGGKKLNIANHKDFCFYYIPNSNLEKYKKITEKLDEDFVSYKFFDRKLENLKEEKLAE